ncbi:hypothetical protein RZS08_34440, partial [Arthrospira platensis SPKY1]|nr:hypothetical protein [Arthrospira platensis SPKY1]
EPFAGRMAQDVVVHRQTGQDADHRGFTVFWEASGVMAGSERARRTAQREWIEPRRRTDEVS